MCGRFVRDAPVAKVAREFGVKPPGFEIEASYNIAPSQNVAILIDDGGKRLAQARWGFLPPWAKDPRDGYKMINARAETVAEKPSFKKAFSDQRCIVPASGFYEWKKDGKQKTPVYIHLPGRPLFGFAGLYGLWAPPGGVKLLTCTIITVEANEGLRGVHDRMPAILNKDDEDKWLCGGAGPGALEGLLAPYPTDEIAYYEVRKEVSSPANDSPENILPV